AVARRQAEADLFELPPWSVEPLENRCMLAGDTFFTAEPLAVAAGGSTTAADAIDPVNDVDIYPFELPAAEPARLQLNAAGQGVAFHGQLTVFGPNGVVLDHFASTSTTQAAIPFQAPSSGVYFVGVAEAGVQYNPFAAGTAFNGSTTAE